MKTFSLYLFVFLLPLSIAVPPEGPNVVDLGIRFDRPLGSNENTNRFSNNSVWKDKLNEDARKLSSVAREAYWQMMNMFFDDPVVAAAIKEWQQRPSELMECQVGLVAVHAGGKPDDANMRYPEHHHQASCSEIMALYAYFADRGGDLTGQDLINKMEDAKNKLVGTHVVTVRSGINFKAAKDRSKPRPYNEIIRYNPCGTEVKDLPKPSLFGCYQTTNDRFQPILEEGSPNHPLSPDEIQYKREHEFEDVDLGDFDMEMVPISCTHLGGLQTQSSSRKMLFAA
ncbi:hypothetical protein P154DRAFT_577749 [Amniculicola lignicola CBS 123094]|uniref:Uncharacterized protein n=1 Tax=Amniculicola lignicola CBS 123094 TaxID=1392246 RepID=A0A6A5WES9_9PLEO|nr:hypothetical protein P154DRAFT_577749 [Amniculicola lignicola CBS 123094]